MVEAGISKTYFMGYAKKAELERVAKGIYLSPDAWRYLISCLKFMANYLTFGYVRCIIFMTKIVF